MSKYKSSSNNYNPSRPYRLELKTPGEPGADYHETINFGPRHFGDAGRDILVARHALGSMELIDIDPARPDIFDNKNHWLDCMTGKEISLREAATFDSTMETYLTKFQLDNQFYILSYLFSKYGAPNLVLNKDLFDRNNDEDTSAEKARAIESEINQIIETQMEFMDSLFSSEFGSLGEATLAILHGWLPRTRVGPTSYYHDPKSFENEHSAHDIVLRGLHQAFVEGTLSQRVEEASEIQDYLTLKSKPLHPQYSYSSDGDSGFGDYLGPNGNYFKNSLEKYKALTSPREHVPLLNQIYLNEFRMAYADVTVPDTLRHFAALSYNLKNENENSMLYSSFLEVSSNFPKSESTSTLSSKDYADAVTRIGEPDPLTDPDPFEISNTVMGFFYKTDYTLEDLPPLKPAPTADISEKIIYQNKIMEVEQQALYSLLKNLNKPVLFKLDPTLASFQDAFTAVGSEYDTIFDSENVRTPNRPNTLLDRARLSELHPDLTASANTWVLAPQPIIDEFRSSESSDIDAEIIDPIQPYTDLEYYPDPENTGLLQKINTLEPLIKFVEFRFPSMRPGDQYRAKFLINRKKIDQITDGLTETQLRTIGVREAEEQRFAPPEVAPGPTVSCEEAPLSPAQQERRYEEYKALAAKRKREIARALRESQVETARKETEMGTTSVDLGVFGNAAVNLGPINMGGFSGSPEEFSNSVLKAGASLLANPADITTEWFYDKAFGGQKNVSIKMTYREIKDRVDVIAKDLREAYTACLEDKVKLNSNYDGSLEATELENALVQLKSYIQKRLPKNSKFQFENDSLAGLLAETPLLSTPSSLVDQALPNQWQSGVRTDYINITFANTGKLRKLSAGQHNIKIDKLKAEAPALARATTSIYFSQLYRMSGGFNMGSWWINPFDVGNSELCSDLDLGKKGLAYLKRYTPGLDGIAKTYEPLQTWFKGNVESPFTEWWKAGQEARSFDTKDIFGADDALKMLGKGCTVPKIMKEFVDRVSLGALLCDFLKCLKIPAFNLQIPDFSYPDWPDFSVFRWWAAAWKFLWDNLGKLVGRFLCTFARTIIDFLRVPWCKEILRDQLFGEASSSTSVVQNAMAAGLLDLGLDQKNADLAPNFIERAGMVLTNRELCRLLQGDPMDPASIAMLTSIAHSMGLDQLDDEESITRLYDHIGMFMPEGFCEALSGTDWLTTATTCEDTATAIADLRMRLLANDASEEEIERVLSEAEGQLMSQARAFEILSEQGLNAVIPPIMDMSNPDAIINALPKNLMDQTSRSIKDFFEPAKMSYVSSLSAYGSAYYLNGFKLLAPGDDDYDEEANIIVETILENFRLLQSDMDSQGSNVSILALQRQIHFLYQVYETTQENETNASTLKLFKYKAIDEGAQPDNDRPQNQLWHNVSPGGASPWIVASFSDRAQSGTKKDDRLYPRPVGFSRNKFFSKDEDNKIITKYYTDESGERDLNRQIEHSKPINFKFSEPILLEPTGIPFHFINNYKLLEKAMDDGDIELGSTISYLQQILSNRMQELQGILSTYLPGITTPQPDEAHLGVIKDAMRASRETNREIQDASALAGQAATQAIYYKGAGQGADAQELKIDFQDSFGPAGPSISLYEFMSNGPDADGRDQRTYDPYTVVLEGSNLFSGEKKTFRFCDAIVGPDNHPGQNARVSVETAEDGSEITYIQPEAGAPNPTATQVFQSDDPIPGGMYTRREIFARRHLDSIRSMAEKYDESWDGEEWHARPEFERLNHNGALRNELYEKHYPEFLEGIFEQVFFSLRNSRIYDEDNYFDSLRRRVSGQVFYNEIERCYKNRYNVSQLGVLSFDKIVTDEIASQIKAEMSRPENSFQNVDYDDIGPIEKAIQNVCLIGFIRICLVELLLKGSLAYSVWDFEGVYDEPLMKDFVYEFVKDELDRIPSISQIWPEIIVRITGIEAKFAALRRLVHQQAIKMQDLSKNVYQNNPNIDYYRWFTKYFIPQSEVSKQMVKSTDEDVFQGGIFVDDDGNVIQNPEEELRDFRRSNHFYWQHPLRNQGNIILNPEIESNSSGLGSIETAKNHVNGNDPFFHIEHGLRVTGPLAALETMILPTREIIAAFTDANYEENPELFTTVDRRVPEILNIEDSLSRVVNLPAVNIEEYRFKETPEISGSAAGSSVEVYDAEGSLAEKEEIYHIDDFLGALNNALNEDDLDKYIKHMQGLYDYDAAPEQAPGGSARNTDVYREDGYSADGYPYAIDRTPTRFIKKTRRVVKFKEDFISHGFGDFFEGHISGWGINIFHNWLKDSSMGPVNLGDGVTLAALQSDCQRRMEPEINSPEEHSYYIIAEDAKQLMKLSNLVDLEYNTQPGPGTIDEKSFDMISLMRGSDEEQTAMFDHVSKTLKHSLSSGPSSAFYNRIKIDSNENVVEGPGPMDAHERVAYWTEGGTLLRTYGAPHLITLPRSADDIGVSTGIQRTLQGPPGSSEFNAAQDELRYQRDLHGPSPEIPFENKLGEFRTEDDFARARALHGIPSNTAGPYSRPGIIPVMSSRDEYWVETVYDFSGDASILAGLYGSFTIGDTFDPAVLHFAPEKATSAALDKFHKDVIEALYPEGELNYGVSHIKNNDDDGMLTVDLSANSRTFFVKAREDRLQGPNQGPVDAPLGPYLIRPMGIDKFSNVAMTAPYLLKNPAENHGNNNDFRRTSPFSTDQGKAHVYGFLRHAQSQNWPWGGQGGQNGENAAGFFGVANVDSQNPRNESCRILHTDKPNIILEGDRIKLEAKKNKLLPPNVYPIPLRILVTRVYVGGMSNPSEVYCRVVMPEYLENLKKSTAISEDVLSRLGCIQSNIGKLNIAIKNILADFTSFHSEVSDGGGKDLTSVDDKIISNHAQPEWGPLNQFPDFTQDYNNRTNIQDSSKLYRSSAINPTSRVQYCSIERVYSKAFENDVARNGHNEKDELDKLFSNRGNLLRPPGWTMSGLAPHNFYSLEKDYNVFAASPANFHMNMRSLQSILDIFLKEKRPDSLWGALSAENVSPLSTEGLGPPLSLGIENPSTNILPRNIEDRTLKFHSGQDLTTLKDLHFHLPDLSFTQTAPLGLTLSARNSTRGYIIEALQLAHGQNLDRPTDYFFIRGILPSWSQALLPTVWLNAFNAPEVVTAIAPLARHFATWKSLSPPAEISSGFHQPCAIARNHNFFAFSSDINNMRLNPPGALQWDSTADVRNALASSLDEIDYYFKGDDLTLIPRYGHGAYNPQIHSGIYSTAAAVIPPELDESLADYNAKNPAQSGMLTDGPGDYLVNYNRVPAIKMPSHQRTSYYADGRLSLADVSIYIRSVVKNALMKTSRRGLEGEGLDGARLDSIYNYGAFLRNTNNVEIMRLIIQQGQASEGAATSEDSFQVVSDEDTAIDNIYAGHYLRRRRNSAPITPALAREAYELIKEFLEGIAVMVSRRYMYSVRTECDIEFGETDFTNPTAPFILNFLIKVYAKIDASSDLSPEEKIAAFAAMSQYDLSQKIIASHVKPGDDQRFQLTEFVNPAQADDASTAAKAGWAQACLYYMHIMLCWLNTRNTFHKAALDEDFANLFYAICINVKHNEPTGFGNDNSTKSEMFRLRMHRFAGYNSGRNMGGSWKERTRFADGSISANYSWGPNRIIGRLGIHDDESHLIRLFTIKPRLMQAFLPGGALEAQISAPEWGIGGIENFIRLVHKFHKAACAGEFGQAPTFMRAEYGEEPAGILEFLKDTRTDPRGFNWPDFTTEDSQFFDDFNPDPANTWSIAWEGYNNSLGGSVAQRRIAATVEKITDDHSRSAMDAYSEQERTTIQNGQIEDILLKLDYDMYKYVFFDRPDGQKNFIKHLKDKGIISESELQPGSEAPQQKGNYDRAVLNVLYTSQLGTPRLAANTIYNIGQTIQTAANMRHHYMSALNRVTGIDQALSAAVFDNALVGLKEGLLRGSAIDQVCRFVSNIPCRGAQDSAQDSAHGLSEGSSFHVNRIARSSIMKKPSEEMRTGFMPTFGDIVDFNSAGFLSTPLAEHARPISPMGEVLINCWPLSSFKEKYHLRQNSFAEILLSKNEVKPILEYIFPVKRFQAISTIYTTATLAGYSTMPSILQAPKHNLAFLTKMSSLNSKERNEFLKNHSQAESMKALMDNPVSDPKNIDCFDSMLADGWWDQFKDMLADLIKYFPSALFRGIASTIDPAYKEMKAHWEQCEIEDLTFRGTRTLSADRASMTAGLQKPRPAAQGSYSMVLPSALRDLIYSTDELISFTPDTKPMKRTLERMTGYLYKGPIALMDGIFAFEVPCLDHSEKWPEESPKAWNADRYGHPMSPFTALALMTHQLPGEKKMRERSNACDDDTPNLYSIEDLNDRACFTPEPSPFGQMPKPEDFE